ncbi:dihydrodipicolinate synthase family protein [Dichotomicrobium thermohalophilum]|uniref:4-hydroxy-tetrahydrodipicolinate synthase n=1 Tax=Dichotomicrobium thermohalophilum TaxID=933063 RepID=A0A397Q2T0_9HYPH|nr:dihydrodipicolinate synthase family protein [Dichotomicrobium thermohalophilum]RIA55358.1 4-hydroxy-tetrahydrodipicolinate synthase [Dichotomicrobium thermohalophilum]
MANNDQMSGVIAPVVTPFNDEGAVDEERFYEHAHWLLSNGCDALAPFGTTSEANSLGQTERKQLLRGLVDSGISPDDLMPGTGMCSLADTLTLTRQAVELGCRGVLLLPPFYYKNVSDDGLFQYVSELIDRMESSTLHIYLYHIPPVAQVGWSVDLVKRLADKFPETVVGLKDSSGDWSYTEAVLESVPDFAVFSGSEDFLLQNRRAGGAGTITAMANINAPMIAELYDKWEEPDAGEIQAQISRIREVIRDAGTIPALKAVLAHYREAPSLRTVRPPLLSMGEAAATKLIRALDEAGFSPSF